MGLFTAKTTPPLTTEQKIARHQAIAEAEVARAAKAGRLEAQTVHAARATAHATLALGYLMQSQSNVTLPSVPEDALADDDEIATTS